MGLPKLLSRIIGAWLSIFLLYGCEATYRTGQVVDSIQNICFEEYRLSVSAKKIGNTVAVLLTHEGVLEQDGPEVKLSEDSIKVLGDVIESIQRVILASDSSISFYVLVVCDPKIPGAYLTAVRYMDDVRRVNAHMISPTEFFARTILDLKYVGIPFLTVNQLSLEDIQLNQFLGWQMAQRIKSQIIRDMQEKGILILPDEVQCAGEFSQGEFVLTLNVPEDFGASLSGDFVQELFSQSTNVVAKVISNYRFNDFESVRLKHPPTGRSMWLPKARLELFR
jgi:hypothetical protein